MDVAARRMSVSIALHVTSQTYFGRSLPSMLAASDGLHQSVSLRLKSCQVEEGFDSDFQVVLASRSSCGETQVYAPLGSPAAISECKELGAKLASSQVDVGLIFRRPPTSCGSYPRRTRCEALLETAAIDSGQPFRRCITLDHPWATIYRCFTYSSPVTNPEPHLSSKFRLLVERGQGGCEVASSTPV
ncbi:hypothetical protein CPB84DRAFT_185489 [Gymnopilus junonius]|uniref:Uncharacterized protein n=1 Tax=Gymnopilus junonius TaxID=109634 RepID=A0A9P5NHE1_GYMJU|nr:hypothetical protein CPB84DRAFT_185489 [Gymnopilus junonius]